MQPFGPQAILSYLRTSTNYRGSSFAFLYVELLSSKCFSKLKSMDILYNYLPVKLLILEFQTSLHP